MRESDLPRASGKSLDFPALFQRLFWNFLTVDFKSNPRSLDVSQLSDPTEIPLVVVRHLSHDPSRTVFSAV